ncbi:hypothetical protein K523DRAFT_322938 [Schizophyllum commune Tattone D]|nr:hypothetical protein K523DRAFT_322938 [Schizophyllum commune Tattone D]
MAGDITDAALNYTLVLRKAKQAELPGWLVRRMLVNNAVSAGVGLVPIVGDVVLAAFKANSRNAALLEEFLRIRGEELIKLQQGGASVSQAAKPTAPKGKKGKGQVVPGVAKADAEQVKPGAGAPSRPAQRATTSTETNVSGKSKRNFRAWFGGGGSQKDKNKGKQPPPPLPPAGDRGRFVENLDDGHRTA